MDSTNSFVIKLQSICRGYVYRKTYIRLLKSVLIIQYQFRKRRKRLNKNITAAVDVVHMRTSIYSASTSSIDDIKIRLKSRLVQVQQNSSQQRECPPNIRSVIKKRLPNAVPSSKDPVSLREETMYGAMIESMMQSKSLELDEEVLSLDSMDIAYQMHVSDKGVKLGKIQCC